MISIEPEDVVYQRVGDEYKPIGAAIRRDCLPAGHWHLHIQPERIGISLLSRNIDPDYLRLHAALKEWMDAIVSAMYDSCKMKVSKRMPDCVVEAYKAMCDSLGEAAIPVFFEYETVERIAQAGMLEIEALCDAD